MDQKRKIKIAQVITRMDWGGSPDVLRTICRRLDPRVYDLRIIIGRTTQATERTKVFFNDFQGRISFIPELKRDICFWDDWAAFWKLYRIFKRERFDIVHTHTAKAGALARLAAALSGVPCVVHIPHGHNFYGYFNVFASRLIILAEKFLGLFTDRIICLTDLERRDYLKFRIVPEKKLVLVYTGLELDKFLPVNPAKAREDLKLPPQARVVGYVGRLDPVKGAQFFVEAAAICLKEAPELRFILIGEGSSRQGLEAEVASSGLTGRIIFGGWREDIADIMSILDILVLPSLNEAVGIVLIEAQSLGVAVVASNVGGVPEIIRDGITGILVKPAEPGAIAGAVLALMKEPARLQAMSAAARAWVKDRFLAETMAGRIASVYLEVLKEKNAEFI